MPKRLSLEMGLPRSSVLQIVCWSGMSD